MRRVIALGIAGVLGCSGGGVIQTRGELPPPPPGTGFVQITCLPKTADIYVDGRYRGRLDGYPRGVLRLTAGQHRIKLAQRGFLPEYALVEVGDRARTVRTWLVPSIDAPPTHRLTE